MNRKLFPTVRITALGQSIKTEVVNRLGNDHHILSDLSKTYYRHAIRPSSDVPSVAFLLLSSAPLHWG